MNHSPKESNLEFTSHKIVPVLKKYDVIRASFFGSVARNEDTLNSDVDILVEFKPGKSLLDLVDLQLQLESLLEKKVDLLTYNSLHPLLKSRILKDERPIML